MLDENNLEFMSEKKPRDTFLVFEEERLKFLENWRLPNMRPPLYWLPSLPHPECGYCMVLNSIAWYLMLLYGIEYY